MFMKQALLYVLVAGSISCFSQGLNWQWARSSKGFGSFSDAEGISSATDKSGNVYITGWFEGNISFGSDTFYGSTESLSSTFYLAKYNSQGVYQWGKGYRCTDAGDNSGYAVAADANGNVYLTGIFLGHQINFGSYNLSNAGGADIFLVKYDSSGNETWAQSLGGHGFDDASAIALDSDGNIYLAGYFANDTFAFNTT